MSQLNDAKMQGKELDEDAILALEKQIELLKERDSIEGSLKKEQETLQTAKDKEQVTKAVEKAKSTRDQRVQKIRDANSEERQKAKALRDLTRQEMKALDPKDFNTKIGEDKRKMMREAAALSAKDKMNKQFPDPAESLDAIRKRLDALAAA